MMHYELISNDHHNNNCALFKCWDIEKNYYKKVSFSEKGNLIIKNEKKGYAWFFNNLLKPDDTILIQNSYLEINIPEFSGKTFPSDAKIIGNEIIIEKFIEFYRQVWLKTEKFVIHGDLALCNIIFPKSGEPNIIDWEHCHFADSHYFGYDIINLLFISLHHEFGGIRNIDNDAKKFINKCITQLFRGVSSTNNIIKSPFKNSCKYLKKYKSRFNLSVPVESKFVLSRYNCDDLKKLDKLLTSQI